MNLFLSLCPENVLTLSCSMEKIMKKLDVIATESFHVSPQQPIDKPLIKKLYEFLAESYHLADQDEFERFILLPNETGELNVLYGLNDQIAGFTRTWQQTLMMDTRPIMTYISYIYLAPEFKFFPTVANTGLTSAVQYKLAHPGEKSIYVVFANNLQAYEFISLLSDETYPKPKQKIPEPVLEIIHALKQQNGWSSASTNPMVTHAPLVPLRSHTPGLPQEHNALNEFYVDVNPGSMQGNALLVYMPLDLANLNYGVHPSEAHRFINRTSAHPKPNF